MKVLVVDDSQAIREIVKSGLRDMGLFDQIAEAANGRQALETLQADGPFDLVLLDWYMPEMEGYDCLMDIRKNANWIGVKVMMVTTENQYDNMVRAVMAGADEYLMKPFTPDMLQEKVRMVLGL